MTPSELTPTQLLGIFAKFFESQQIPYRVVGSMASMAYGEPRMTIDVDIVAQWLPNFSSLTLLDISDNPLLGDAGVACVLSAITGACMCCS